MHLEATEKVLNETVKQFSPSGEEWQILFAFISSPCPSSPVSSFHGSLLNNG